MKCLSAVLMCMVALLMFVMSSAYAADVPVVADTGGGAALAAFLQATVFPVITALFMGIVVIFLRKLGEKFGIDTLTQKNNILERLALQGITLAEEKAAQLAGSRAALTGNQKLDVAVSHVLAFMPKVSTGQAAALVESMLAQISGVGATKDAAFSTGAAYPSADIVSATAA
jgi:hypothetical protein